MLAAVARWRLSAEAVASVTSSKSCYDVIEDVSIISVVEIAEEWQETGDGDRNF
jgi:hypothetical protein